MKKLKKAQLASRAAMGVFAHGGGSAALAAGSDRVEAGATRGGKPQGRTFGGSSLGKRARTFLAVALAALLAIWGWSPAMFGSKAYAAVNVGANPAPKVDIAVNVPADYPGTFLDFKQELTQKLIDQGMDPSSFRITDTAAKIDTTNLDGWYVYDHYYNQAQYDALSLSAEQKEKQPFRGADNSHTTGGVVTMESLLKNGNISGCRNFTQHIWTYADEGKANMVFAGYGTQPLLDYMIYPAASDSRRTVSFDVDGTAIGAHTLMNYGFFLNAGIENGKVVGYVLCIDASHNGAIAKVNLPVNSNASANLGGTVVPGGTFSVGLPSTKKARLTVDIQKNKVTVQKQNYDASGNLGAVVDLKSVALDTTGYNGFGPFVGYASHGCSELTVMRFLDMEMKYEASAFDALKNTQFYQGAEQKYFINLMGSSNDPKIPEEVDQTYADGINRMNENDALKNTQFYQGAEQKYFINLMGSSNDPKIPEEVDQTYADGINRMNENEIFYISNGQDGKIVTDSTDDHQGLGADNGLIAMDDDYVTQMAKWIYTNNVEGKKFNQAPIKSELPLANFYLVNKATDEQLMTIHQKHLADGESVEVGFVDKSQPGTLAGKDGKIAQWCWRVYNPDNTVVYDSKWQTDLTQITPFAFTNKSKSGRWTFELQVKDQANNESKSSQTYITVFLDEDEPFIEGANTGRNIATITLTDTGMGIDEDGITFIEDGRGSGVAAYWVTNDLNATPTEDDWEILPTPEHQFSFDYEVTSTEPLVVWVRDECGNVGNKAVFQPTHVKVEDMDGNPIDDYFVIGDKPIIVLPEDEDIPPYSNVGNKAVFQPTHVKVEDMDGNPIDDYFVIGDKPIIVLPEDEDIPPYSGEPEEGKDPEFSGWTTPGGDPVTPGTTPTPEDNTIVIRPQYSTEYAQMIYLANGGDINGKKAAEFQVVSESSIYKKIGDHNVQPTRVGYTFTGWKLLKGTGGDINGKKAAEFQVVSESSIYKKIGDHNVQPTRVGYTFTGWKLLKGTTNEEVNGLVNLSTGSAMSGSFTDAQLTDVDTARATKVVNKETSQVVLDRYYLVAQWEVGNYTLRFDANGGSLGNVRSIGDVAYGTNVGTLGVPTQGRGVPTKPGYIFQGWSTSKNAMDDTKNTFAIANGISGITAVPAPVMPASDMTVYAVWKYDTNKFVVSFDSDGGSRVGDVAYQKSNAPTYATATMPQFPTPSKTGYDFTGWHFVNEDGTLADEVTDGTEAPLSTGNHTFKATWTPRDDTKYAVEYWYNTGAKDAEGKAVYAKANDATKTYSAATESSASVTAGDKTAQITVDGTKFWYNAANANNVLTGTVTGSPTLALRLYYDRYLDVTVTKAPSSTGNGTVTSKTEQPEGSTPTVTWQAAAGSHVSKVTVDGVVRDDLIAKGSFTPAGGLTDNVNVVVEFTKDDPSNPSNPGGTDVPRKAFTVTTEVHGCNGTAASKTGECTITPTRPYDAGSDARITWDVCGACKISRVVVDGQEVQPNGNAFDFKGLAADHKVAVYVTSTDMPTMGGQETDGCYTITVNRYGGDDKYTTSPSQTIPVAEAATANWKFEWAKNDSAYRIYEIRVDGKTVRGGLDASGNIKEVKDTSSYGLAASANHVVDVYFYDLTDPEGGEPPVDPNPDPSTPPSGYEIPDFSDPTEWVKVTTQIIGGAGEIDGGFAAKKEEGKEHVVSYKVDNADNYDDPSYTYYEVTKVEVDGDTAAKVDQGKQKEEGKEHVVSYKVDNADNYDDPSYTYYEVTKVEVDGDTAAKVDQGKQEVTVTLTQDADVKVYVEPVSYEVETLVVTRQKDGAAAAANNGGTIAASRTVGKFGNYANITATPSIGFRLGAVEVTDKNNGADASESGTITYLFPKDGGETQVIKNKVEWTGTSRKAVAPAIAEATAAATPAPADQAQAPAPADVAAAPSSPAEPAADADAQAPAERPATIVDAQAPASAEPAADATAAVEPQVQAAEDDGLALIEKAYAADTPTNGPGATPNLFTEPVLAGGNATVGITNITEDQMVIAHFVDVDATDDEVKEIIADRQDDKLHKVSVVFEGAGALAPTVTGEGFVADGGSAVLGWGDLSGYKVTAVNGKPVTDADAKGITLSDIKADTVVTVTLEPVKKPTAPIEEGGFEPKYVISTNVRGYGALNITPTKTVSAGANHTVDWAIEYGQPAALADEADAPAADGQELNKPYIIDVEVDGTPAKKGENSFTHNDEKISTTENGATTFSNVAGDHNVVVTTVLLNEDSDNDGKPDNNVDTDGDGKPDLNVDTDGDGKPDVNVDTDGDGDPDTNVDTDGDGKPDINIDTDGDGKPDVNVDTDGDGKPDVNIDTDDDGKPDVNIDEDGDGKPEVNVDTDGDGEPDRNVDTDGDGVPDVDIVDEDGDGKPDPIDPTKPAPKPNVNVDTDGDGEPDVSIDTDGDGKPDINIVDNRQGRRRQARPGGSRRQAGAQAQRERGH